MCSARARPSGNPVRELRPFGIDARVHDPTASAPEALREYGIQLAAFEELRQFDALVLAVSHKQYLDLPVEQSPGCCARAVRNRPGQGLRLSRPGNFPSPIT